MPAGKRQQSNAMLYTLVTFVGLFVVATTAAVIFYIKFEDEVQKADSAQAELAKMASTRQVRDIGSIVGSKQVRESYMDRMVDYLDRTVSIVIGQVPEDTSAEVKFGNIESKTKDAIASVQSYLDTETPDPNTAGLVPVVGKLKIALDGLTTSNQALNDKVTQLQNQFDDAIAATQEKEQTLLAEKEAYKQQVDQITANYNELKTLLEQSTEQQIQMLATQLDEEKTNSKNLNSDLLKTQAELSMARNKIQQLQDELGSIVPPPDSEVAAFVPDGEIILIDDAAKIVHLNLGSDDGVYPGLTFSVYDRNAPIPKDGKGKAEVEVFRMSKNISTARILRSQINNPMVISDIVANLIWDRDRTNMFVVSGDFDLNNDGSVDLNSEEKVKALIGKWGGAVGDSISVDTDFLILGQTPMVLRRPTFEQMEVDPLAMQKYEESLARLNHYREVQERAESLSVPIFNTERFLYLIGYKTQSGRPGAF